MARRGSFGTGTSPFARAARYSDLSVYNFGGTQAPTGGYGTTGFEAWNPPAGYGAGWSATYGDDGKITYTPPPRPTVAPPAGSFYGSLVLPVPVLPEAMVPGMSYVPEENFGNQWQGER